MVFQTATPRSGFQYVFYLYFVNLNGFWSWLCQLLPNIDSISRNYLRLGVWQIKLKMLIIKSPLNGFTLRTLSFWIHLCFFLHTWPCIGTLTMIPAFMCFTYITYTYIKYVHVYVHACYNEKGYYIIDFLRLFVYVLGFNN